MNDTSKQNPDVNKTLLAYGAELDELRVMVREQGERIAALEVSAKGHRAYNIANREMTVGAITRIAQLEREIDQVLPEEPEVERQVRRVLRSDLLDRIADEPSEYAPGWVREDEDSILLGMNDCHVFDNNLTLRLTFGESEVMLSLDDGSPHGADLPASTDDLKRLAACIDIILQRMEGSDAHEHKLF